MEKEEKTSGAENQHTWTAEAETAKGKERGGFDGLKDVGQAENLLSRYQRDYSDHEGAETMLNDMLDALLAPGVQLTGSADEFHNFSVSISKLSGDNRDALAIVEAGLELHADNTDLLADAILYGRNCGERGKCATWYQKLLGIEKSAWTWRAFSFAIDYLIEEYASKKVDVEEILELAKEYQRQKPDEEDAWLSEYEAYEKTNSREKGLAVLLAADQRFSFCPKCWLRYADIMMEKGNYVEAEAFIKKLRLNPKSGESVNISYVFFLDGLNKMTRMMASEAYEDGEYDKKEIMKIYKTFRLALCSPELRDNIKQQIDGHISRLEAETEILYPEYWER